MTDSGLSDSCIALKNNKGAGGLEGRTREGRDWNLCQAAESMRDQHSLMEPHHPRMPLSVASKKQENLELAAAAIDEEDKRMHSLGGVAIRLRGLNIPYPIECSIECSIG